MHPRRPGLVARCLAASVVALAPVPASAGPSYRPPTDRPVVQPFDLSRGPYGPGNRGLDYGVRPGDPIAAIGAGTVVFAGAVAGSRFVTVLHPDGLRSSYSYLDRIDVEVGRAVTAGQVIGTSSGRFQLGVRRRSTYIDPAPLLARLRPRHARLVR